MKLSEALELYAQEWGYYTGEANSKSDHTPSEALEHMFATYPEYENAIRLHGFYAKDKAMIILLEAQFQMDIEEEQDYQEHVSNSVGALK